MERLALGQQPKQLVAREPLHLRQELPGLETGSQGTRTTVVDGSGDL
jgi:hypothetical protein